MRTICRICLLLATCGTLLLGGCATPGEPGDSPPHTLSTVTGISELYSQVSLRAQMALTREDDATCQPHECEQRQAFDKRVTNLGAKLASAAYLDDPALKERIPQFSFSVVNKAEPGSASTAAGNVFILRPVGDMLWSDEALSFVIAREMGHVIAKHHEINTGISIAVSVAVGVIAPVVNLAKLLAVLYSGSTASTAATGITNAASFVGSRAIIATYWPTQRQTADMQALKLLTSSRMDYSRVPAGMARACTAIDSTRWTRELDDSVAMVGALHEYPPAPTEECKRAIADETTAILAAAETWPASSAAPDTTKSDSAPEPE